MVLPQTQEARLGFLCNSIKFSLCRALCRALGMGDDESDSFHPEELTVWWERQTSKQIMQCSVVCARTEVCQAAQREGVCWGGRRTSGLNLFHPLLKDSFGGVTSSFGSPPGLWS